MGLPYPIPLETLFVGNFSLHTSATRLFIGLQAGCRFFLLFGFWGGYRAPQVSRRLKTFRCIPTPARVCPARALCCPWRSFCAYQTRRYNQMSPPVHLKRPSMLAISSGSSNRFVHGLLSSQAFDSSRGGARDGPLTASIRT